MGSNIFWYLPPVGLQLIVDISTWSKSRWPGLVVSTSQATLVVPPSGSCPNVPSPPSGTCLTSPSQNTLSVILSEALPTPHQRHGHSWNCRKAKGAKEVKNKFEGLMGMGIFVASTLSLWYVIIFPNILVTPPLWSLINFLDDGSLLSINFDSSAQQSITKFSKYLTPWGGSAIWAVFLGSFFNYSVYL